jgi:hypothetical protein
VLLEDFEFIIKLEDDTPVKAEADIEPGRVGPPPTKVEHDGIRQTRGYAMVGRLIIAISYVLTFF